jgi:hypothetical protein
MHLENRYFLSNFATGFCNLKINSMTLQEQEKVKERYYLEAIRYMDNAKETLEKAKKKDNFYQDAKYVKTACGIAYNGMLIALDGYLMLKGVEKPKGKRRKSIEYYQENMGKHNRKLLDYLNGAYNTLHLSGYYDGNGDAIVIKRGFDNAYFLIEKIKP